MQSMLCPRDFYDGSILCRVRPIPILIYGDFPKPILILGYWSIPIPVYISMLPIYRYVTDSFWFFTDITLNNRYHTNIPIPISPMYPIPIPILGVCFIQIPIKIPIPVHTDFFHTDTCISIGISADTGYRLNSSREITEIDENVSLQWKWIPHKASRGLGLPGRK